MISPMLMSCIPQGLMGMSKFSSSPCLKGMLLLSSIHSGTKCWLGANILWGSQPLLCSIALARSQINSEIVPHSDRHGFPPKLEQSIIRSRPISTSYVQVCMAVTALRSHCWKAHLKSNFDARFRVFGYFLHAKMAQLTIRLMHAPNVHRRSYSALMQMFTDVLDNHL